ncbi:GDP-fucose protein O-fucosyltransferase 2 isoform X3 [Coturnix japonica]|uniref:GDP-fucose protein O-fucosyltransferase 2 isoform X3 n=1 Tax=Coturnix japonica TaxID=93934 RepID=UPI0013A5CEBC|nr:GDP-fucose protein O-fucosyltransferase 2 isoform X3 [Coturnix japonica]
MRPRRPLLGPAEQRGGPREGEGSAGRGRLGARRVGSEAEGRREGEGGGAVGRLEAELGRREGPARRVARRREAAQVGGRLEAEGRVARRLAQPVGDERRSGALPEARRRREGGRAAERAPCVHGRGPSSPRPPGPAHAPSGRGGPSGRSSGAMSVQIRIAQRAVPLRRVPLRRAVCALRAALGAERFDVALICAGDGLMKRLNGAYRRRNEPTDVLSFPYHRVSPGQLPRPRSRDEFNLGDIFLGVEFIQRHCRRHGEDLDAVLTVTAAHGLCHLLGYQHNTKAEWLQMYQKEAEILEELNRLTGTSLRPLTAGLF